MRKPGRNRAASPVNLGNVGTRQEAWLGKPPTKPRYRGYYLAQPGSPQGPKGVWYTSPQTSRLTIQPPLLAAPPQREQSGSGAR